MITTSIVIRVDPCGLQVRLILAERTLGLRVGAETEAGVDGDEFRSGIDDGRRIGVDHLVLRQELRLEIFGNSILRCVDDVAVSERVAVLPIGDDGDFEFANLIAVPSGVLFARGRRRSIRRRHYCLRSGNSGANGSTADKQRTAREFSHDVPPVK